MKTPCIGELSYFAASNFLIVRRIGSLVLALLWAMCTGQFVSAQEDMERPVPVRINNVNDPRAIDFSPTISADGRTLIFQSNRNSDRDFDRWELFQSEKNALGTWSAPRPISVINDNFEFIAGPNLSYDGNSLYFTAYVEEEEQYDIFYSVRLGDSWSPPVRMEAPINTNRDYEGFSSISSDEKQFYFMVPNLDYRRDRRTREDCFLIYVSYKTESGHWANPLLLPEKINTGCVRDPKIMADNRTLLYSSLEIDGSGQFNLYQSQLDRNRSWSDPISLDFVNVDEVNNLAPAIPASGDSMYYYSEGDIYSIYIPPEYRQFFNATVQGSVTAFGSGDPVNATIIVRNAKDLSVINRLTPGGDGRYSMILNGGTNYRIEFQKEGHLSEKIDYNLYYLNGYLEDTLDVRLKSVAGLGLVVYDRDLDHAIPANISVFEDGRLVETFQIDDYDEQKSWLNLKSKKRYTILASSPNYRTDSVQVNTYRPNQGGVTIFLEPLKVDYEFNVRDVTTRKKIRTKVTLKNQDEDEIINGYSDETFQLRLGDQYEVLASGDRGYLFAAQMVSASEQTASGAGASVDIDVAPAAVNVSLVLNNITFETNSADLEPSSMLELDKIVEFMELNPSVDIEISAHSDNVGAADYNLRLSDRRAASVKDYLVNHEVPTQRINSVGFGETQPISPNDTEENRRMNRRVELRITALHVDE